mgnify:FL=1
MSEIRVDTISEKTSANGVSIDGLTIKDGGITATTGAIVFNEASADVDFRVESDDNVNMLFVDGGNDRVGVGTGTPSSALEIVGASSVPQLTVRSNNATAANNAGLLLYNTDSATAASRKVELVLDADGANASGTDYLLIKKTGNNGDAEIRNANNANLIFSTNNAEKWRIDNTGNLVPGATSLGIYLGVSSATAANLLDDYEEGTFAYTITGSTSGNLTARSGYARGYYVKIGNLVQVNIRFETDGDNSISGNLRWSLPFTMASVNGSDQDASIGAGYIRDNSLGTNARTGVYYGGQGLAYVQYLFSREGAANSTIEVATDANTDGTMEGVISISYQTT